MFCAKSSLMLQLIDEGIIFIFSPFIQEKLNESIENQNNDSKTDKPTECGIKPCFFANIKVDVFSI